MPNQLLKAQLAKEVVVHGTRCQQLAIAIASLHGTRNDWSRKRYACGQRVLRDVPSGTATPTEGVVGFTSRA
jgi:hypothetical protein